MSENLVHRLLNRVFGLAEEINGHERCSTYLYRWEVLRNRHGKLYLHRFVGDDWSLDVHDHPKRFVSIGLWGSYLEHVGLIDNHGDHFTVEHEWRAPWFRTFPADHRHRITTPWGECWTLVWVGLAEREWGFWHEGRFYGWEDYVRGPASHIADAQKACD